MLPDLTASRELLLGLAGLGAGLVNGVAGGGSLVSFPALLAVGFPALSANVTSTIGIWPGYLGGAAGFSRELAGQRQRALGLLPALLVGSVGGGVLLLTTPSKDFSALAPYLILFACALFAIQPWLAKSLRENTITTSRRLALQIGTALSACYGAYFGAGLGVILLGVLASCIPDRLVRINGLRSVLSLLINTVAALIFAADAPVSWSAAGLLALGALTGGYLGARVARVLPAIWLRVVVVALGLVTAARLLAG